MKKFWLLLMAMLTACAIFLSSCSEDPDDDDSDGSGPSGDGASVSDVNGVIEDQLSSRDTSADKNLLAENLNDTALVELLREVNSTKIKFNDIIGEPESEQIYLTVGDNYMKGWIKDDTLVVDVLDGTALFGAKIYGEDMALVYKLPDEDVNIEFVENDVIEEFEEEVYISDITEGALEDIIEFIDEYIDFAPAVDKFKFVDGYYMLDTDYIKDFVIELISEEVRLNESEIQSVADVIDFEIGFAVKSEKITAIKFGVVLEEEALSLLEDFDLDPEGLSEFSMSFEMAFGEIGVSPFACVMSASVKFENGVSTTVNCSEAIAVDESGIPTAMKYDYKLAASGMEIGTDYAYDNNDIAYMGSVIADFEAEVSIAVDLENLTKTNCEILKAGAKMDISNISFKYQQFDENNFSYVDVSASVAEKFFDWSGVKLLDYVDASASVSIVKDEDSILQMAAVFANGSTSVSVGGAIKLETDLKNVTLPENEITDLFDKSYSELKNLYSELKNLKNTISNGTYVLEDFDEVELEVNGNHLASVIKFDVNSGFKVIFEYQIVEDEYGDTEIWLTYVDVETYGNNQELNDMIDDNRQSLEEEVVKASFYMTSYYIVIDGEYYYKQ